MNELRLSVVIPTHNRAHLVGRALRSVLSEISPDDEVLVIDDGSTDGTGQVVQAFQDNRIRYIWQANAGAGAARNRGIREATGDLLAFLDSDDEWLPGKVALQRRFMTARPDILFCFTDLAREYGGRRYSQAIRYWHTDPRGWDEILGPAAPYSSIAELTAGLPDCQVYVGDIYAGEMHTNYPSTITLMVRRHEAGNALRFAEGVRTFEDWECFGRLAGCGLAALLTCETAVQYGHSGPRLTDADILTCAESRITVLQNVWGADPAFLATHGSEYRDLMRAQRLQKIRGLLVLGRSRDARQEIERLGNVSAGYRAASWVPGPCLKAALQLRRALLSWLPYSRRDSMRLTRLDQEQAA